MWQPMKTAPRDGSMILAFNAAHRDMAVVGWTADIAELEDFDNRDAWTDVGNQNRAITLMVNPDYYQYWMPLPAPPL